MEVDREISIHNVPIVLQVEDNPKTFKESMASRDSAFLKEAIQDEIDSIMSNHTNWRLSIYPKVQNLLDVNGCLRRSTIVMVL